MKQLLFLLLFPCLALAQYQGNAGQKITLGEQTTADGLVWRGIRADTTSKIVPFSDTSAYIILDTVEKTLWLYKAGQIPKWQQVGGSTLDTATMLLPYWRSGRFSGVLPVANGGTNTSTAFTAGSVVFAGASGTYSQDNSNLFWDNTNKRLGIGTTSPTFKLDVLSSSTTTAKFTGATNAYVDFTDGIVNTRLQNSGGLFFGTTTNNDLTLRTNAVSRLTITSGGNVGIGTISPQSGYRLHVVDSVYVGGNVSASAYTTRSDYDLKDEIQNISYGINEVMQMQPVKYTYKSNGSTQLGFIAQDLGVITPEVVSFEDKMSVYYNALIPILTKAIQEQQALIKALEQRIINLENK